MPASLKALLAISCCLILANIYYTQAILTDIAAHIGLSLASCGMIITTIQIGYCLGILFLVPLGDFIQNRTLISILTLCNSTSLFLVGYSSTCFSFFAAIFCVGFFSSCVQIIIPFAMSLAHKQERGSVMSLVISGAILGIVLARPISSVLTSTIEWTYVFYLASFLMLLLTPVLYLLLPSQTYTQSTIRYTEIFTSMKELLSHLHGLKPRLFVMALAFASFTMFWTTVPILLDTQLHFSHTDIALFSLMGIVTPICAIVTGKMIDKGYANHIAFIGIGMVLIGYSITPMVGIFVGSLIAIVFFIDPGANITNIVIQQSSLSMLPEARSRINALCMTFTFIGGAIGSFIGPWLYSHCSWFVVAYVGMGFMVVALIVYRFTIIRRAKFL